MPIPFDTLDYAQKLEHAGLSAAHAAAQSKVLAEVLSQAVTFPGNLTALERNLITKIETMERSVTAKIDAAELRLTGMVNQLIWITVINIALCLAILVKLFVH